MYPTDEEAVKTPGEIKAQEEYDKAFSEEPKNGTHPHEEPDPGADPDGKEVEKTPDVTPDPAEQKDPAHGDIESMSKAIRDSKVHIEKLSIEKKALEKKVAEFEAGKATQKDVDQAQKALEIAQDGFDKKLKAVFEDYPELEEILTPMVSVMKSQAEALNEVNKVTRQSKEEKARTEARAVFERDKLPDIVKAGHTDAKEMINDPRYFQWASSKASVEISQKALNSPEPSDIAEALTEFKKFLLTPEAEKLKNQQEKTKEKMIASSQGLRGGASDFPSRKPDGNKQDYDAGWDDADKILEKQGVR